MKAKLTEAELQLVDNVLLLHCHLLMQIDSANVILFCADAHVQR